MPKFSIGDRVFNRFAGWGKVVDIEEREDDFYYQVEFALNTLWVKESSLRGES